MLGLQISIGATNDVVDLPLDRVSKPDKPLVSGLVRPASARRVAVAAAILGLSAAALAGPLPFLMAGVMLGCGLLYDFRLKPTAFAWVCFSVAFAILPLYAWFGAVGAFLPRPELVLPLAAASGPQLQLANGLVDLEDDRRAGQRTLAVRLGRSPALLVVALLTASIHGIAWATLGSGPGMPIVVVASGSAVAGLACLSLRDGRLRQAGWVLQATSLALLGLGWLSAVA
jgi:4-hydroxybenzoate polyprenyltransferase